MRRLISSLLLVTLIVTALMIVSCAREEKPSQDVAKVEPTKTAEPPPQPETVPMDKPDPPPKTAGPPPVHDMARPPSQRQTVDIMSGNPVKSNIYSDYKGKRVYFCCEESKRRFELDSEAWMKRAEELGMVLQDAPSR
jgi:YHS domain-containing protein